MSDFNSSLPIRTETAGDVSVKLVDSSTPSQGLSIDSSGRLSTKLTDGAGNLLASSTTAPTGTEQALVVRTITSGTQAVTGTFFQATQPVSGTVSATQSGPWDFNLKDAAGVGITSQANGLQQALDVGITVTGIQIDPREIRDLTNNDVVSANLRDESGNPYTQSNPLAVYVASSLTGDEVINFSKSIAVAGAATFNHDYTVTTGKVFSLKQIEATASSKSKIEVQIETGVATGTFTTVAVLFNSTANPNMSIVFEHPQQVIPGAKVRLAHTNRDQSPQDLYSTILGQEAAV